MQNLLIKVSSTNDEVSKTTFESDKEARIVMGNTNLAPNFKFDVENVLQSNICIANFLQKILKKLAYQEEVNERDFLLSEIVEAKRLTNDEKSRLVSLIDILYPCDEE